MTVYVQTDIFSSQDAEEIIDEYKFNLSEYYDSFSQFIRYNSYLPGFIEKFLNTFILTHEPIYTIDEIINLHHGYINNILYKNIIYGPYEYYYEAGDKITVIPCIRQIIMSISIITRQRNINCGENKIMVIINPFKNLVFYCESKLYSKQQEILINYVLIYKPYEIHRGLLNGGSMPPTCSLNRVLTITNSRHKRKINRNIEYVEVRINPAILDIIYHNWF